MSARILDERATRVLRGALGPLKGRFGSDTEGVDLLLDLAIVVARADGEIDEEERKALAAAFSTVLGEADEAKVSAQIAARIAGIEKDGLEARAEGIGRALHARNAADEGLVAAIAIAQASGDIGGDERRVLERIARGADADDDLEVLIHQISAAVAKDG